MIDHLKTNKKTAIELLKNNPNSLDLELIGNKDLPRYSKNYEYSELSEDLLFKNVFGTHTNFIYVIQSVCCSTNSVCLYERGVGYIYENNGSYFLKRTISFVRGKNHSDCSVNYSNTPLDFYCSSESKYTILTSSLPYTYLESLVVPNSVLCSSDMCLPQPVTIKENSFLVRFDERIESVEFEDDRLIDKITKIISKFTKQLKLKASKLSLKRVEPEIIDMVPTSNVKAKRGSLYYDESDNKLKLYDGQQWKTIAFTEE